MVISSGSDRSLKFSSSTEECESKLERCVRAKKEEREGQFINPEFQDKACVELNIDNNIKSQEITCRNYKEESTCPELGAKFTSKDLKTETKCVNEKQEIISEDLKQDTVCLDLKPNFICPELKQKFTYSGSKQDIPRTKHNMLCTDQKQNAIYPDLNQKATCSDSKQEFKCPDLQQKSSCPQLNEKVPCLDSKKYVICSDLKQNITCHESKQKVTCPQSADKITSPGSNQNLICSNSKQDITCPDFDQKKICLNSKEKVSCLDSKQKEICSPSKEKLRFSDSKKATKCPNSITINTCKVYPNRDNCNEESTKDEVTSHENALITLAVATKDCINKTAQKTKEVLEDPDSVEKAKQLVGGVFVEMRKNTKALCEKSCTLYEDIKKIDVSNVTKNITDGIFDCFAKRAEEISQSLKQADVKKSQYDKCKPKASRSSDKCICSRVGDKRKGTADEDPLSVVASTVDY